MFLRCNKRKKDGKVHRYYSIVENRRVANGRVVQKPVLYLGEITDDQQKGWGKSLEVFDVDQNRPLQKYLFAVEDDQTWEDIDAIAVKLSQMVLSNPRDFGDCWLGCRIWQQLGLDHILTHKDALCEHLKTQWQTMFDLEYDILLYDLTSTYFEGMCQGIPKAKFGHSKDRRSDCRQILIALVVTPEGFPINYEVLPGNTAEKTTLTDLLTKIETQYGKARRTWLMDRGIPTEQSLSFMREAGIEYLVGTPRKLLDEFQERLLDVDWQQANESVRVKYVKDQDETYVLACSKSRMAKERAMRKRKLRA